MNVRLLRKRVRYKLFSYKNKLHNKNNKEKRGCKEKTNIKKWGNENEVSLYKS